jgi:hypothetical protein
MRLSTSMLAAMAGFLGGFAGSHLPTVNAQTQPPAILNSRDFVLVDAAGHKRGEWKLDTAGQPVLRLFGPQGQVIWETKGGAQLLGSPAIR